MTKPIVHRMASGKYVRINRDYILGLCEENENNKKVKYLITINPKLKPSDELDTFVHELCHAEMPLLSEKHIQSLSNSIARLLWKIGYRRRVKK